MNRSHPVAQRAGLVAAWAYLVVLALVALVVDSHVGQLPEQVWIYSGGGRYSSPTLELWSRDFAMQNVSLGLALYFGLLVVASLILWAVRKKIVFDGLAALAILAPVLTGFEFAGETLSDLLPQLGRLPLSHSAASSSLDVDSNNYGLGLVVVPVVLLGIAYLVSRRLARRTTNSALGDAAPQ
jgi:hypothetical protein